MSEEVTQEDVSQEDVAAFLGEGASQEVLDEYESTDETPEVEVEEETPEAEVKVETPDTEVEEETPDTDTETPGDISSKSGKYTIPYEKLTEARDGRKAAEQQTEDLTGKLETMQKQLDEALAGKSDTDTETPDDDDDNDLDDLKEEFPQFFKKFEEISNKLDALQVANEDSAATAEQTATVEHFDSIEVAHENSQEILTSQEFKSWIDELPPVMQNAYIDVYQQGDAGQVIEMLDAFLGMTSPEVVPEVPKQDVADKIKEAKEKVSTPKSLSDIPGDAPLADPVEQLETSPNSGKTVDDLYAGKSQDEINKLLDKLL